MQLVPIKSNGSGPIMVKNKSFYDCNCQCKLLGTTAHTISTLSITTSSITAFSITALIIKGLFATHSLNATQHNSISTERHYLITLLSVAFYCCAECNYAECHYAECCGASYWPLFDYYIFNGQYGVPRHSA